MNCCAFCDAKLGANTLLAEYPVGRTLAYDAGRDLLWSVCPKCRAWNLSHLDLGERKHAIERLDQLLASTLARSDTTTMGIAKLGARGTLYKVGAGGWRQFAAWRYGERIMRQRWRFFAHIAFSLAFSAFMFSDIVDRFVMARDWALWVMILGIAALLYWSHRGVMFRGADVTGRDTLVRNSDAFAAKIAGHSEDWTLTVGTKEPKIFSGRTAVMLLSRILRQRNGAGATRRQVDEALDMIERAGGPHQLLGGFLRAAASGDSFGVQDLTAVQRIGLEMATHEEAERRALATTSARLTTDADTAIRRADLVSML